MSDDYPAEGLVGDRRKTPTVPDFTAQQTWVMDVIAEKAAQRAVDKLVERGCPFSCDVKVLLYGDDSAGVPGMKQRLVDVESTIGRLNRITWIAVSGVVLAVIGLIGMLVQVGIVGK